MFAVVAYAVENILSCDRVFCIGAIFIFKKNIV